MPFSPLQMEDWNFWFFSELRRNNLKVDEIGLDVISIALPAVLSLAADPIASLVDTAFVGHLGGFMLSSITVNKY